MPVFAKHLFPGGIHPVEGVNGKSVNDKNAIRELPAPPRVIIPLAQHVGKPAKAVVAKGDHVKIGQVIGEANGFVSAPIHASVSGEVVAVQDAMLANGKMAPAIIIDNDYQNEWVELKPCDHPDSLTPKELADLIREAGIVGLGGATFPTAVKLSPGPDKKIEMLIVNGAECEPYLTADHRLMLENAAEIIDGLKIMMKTLGVGKALIGLENNKMDAAEALKKAASGAAGIEVHPLPVRYPQGGEKQLIYALTRRKVPTGGLPIDVGCVVCNAGTVYAVQQAVRYGRPLIERVTTMGGLVNKPGNFRVRIGTPIADLVDACGGFQKNVKQLIYGGPMMGTTIARTDIPVTKGCSGILALNEPPMEPLESACIRCGRCVDACPMRLQPTKMDMHIRHDEYEAVQKLGLMNCIECGACTFVCPAKRSLTQSFRQGKAVIRMRQQQAAKKGS